MLAELHELDAPLPRLLPSGSDVRALEEELGVQLPGDHCVCDKRWPSFAAWLDEVWVQQRRT